MPLEDEEVPKKEEGGEKLDQEAVRNIAVAVKSLIDQDKEKETVSQELGEMKKLLCAPDGGPCFLRKEDFDRYMAEQAKKDEERRQEQKKTIDGLDSKIGEVAMQIKGLGQAGKKETLPGGVQRLPDVTAEVRAGMSKEDNEARDLEVKAIADYFRVSDNDQWRRVEKNPVNLDAIAKKQSMRKRVFDGITDQELKDVTLMACRDGKCRPFREGMEKEAGIKFYAKDKRGRFQPVDQEEKEGSYI